MKYKRIAAICMIAVLAVSFGFNTSAAAQENAGTTRQSAAEGTGGQAASLKGKDEVVYARLSADGAVDSMYVVNHFEALQAGAVTDYGNYESVCNLTDTCGLAQNGDSIAFVMSGDHFYYQGNMSGTDLPWIFDFSYYLDGVKTGPQELAGKNGRMELRIATKRNEKINPVFYDHYMLQITVTLDTEKCANIEAPDGTCASAGKNKVIAYTVMPGSDADYILKADVTDFTMTGIQVSGVPYSMNIEIPDMDEKLADLEKLPEAISELNDGVSELKDGTGGMKDGAYDLVNGSAGIKQGLELLGGNSKQLADGSAKIKDALSGVAAALNADSLKNVDLSQMTQLAGGLNQLAQGLRGVSAGLTQMKDGFVPAYAALDAAIQSIPEGTVTQADIDAINRALTDVRQQERLQDLAANYFAAQTVKQTYAQVKTAFDAVGASIGMTVPSMDQMAANLESMSSQIGSALGNLSGLEQLGQLSSGMAQLSSNYSCFHSGLIDYLNGLNTLVSNYGAFHSGLAEFGSGVGELDSGIGELHDGTTTLKDEVAGLPDMLLEEIDQMKSEYLPSDFDPVSFTSPKNRDTQFVQFVLQCGGIEKPEAEETPPAESGTETFWDRLLALFQIRNG